MAPSTSEKQRKFMGAELRRRRRGQATRTGMSERQLRDFAEGPVKKPTKRRPKKRRAKKKQGRR